MGSVRHETIIDVDLDTEKANAKAKQLQALIDQLSGAMRNIGGGNGGGGPTGGGGPGEGPAAPSPPPGMSPTYPGGSSAPPALVHAPNVTPGAPAPTPGAIQPVPYSPMPAPAPPPAAPNALPGGGSERPRSLPGQADDSSWSGGGRPSRPDDRDSKESIKVANDSVRAITSIASAVASGGPGMALGATQAGIQGMSSVAQSVGVSGAAIPVLGAAAGVAGVMLAGLNYRYGVAVRRAQLDERTNALGLYGGGGWGGGGYTPEEAVGIMGSFGQGAGYDKALRDTNVLALNRTGTGVGAMAAYAGTTAAGVGGIGAPGVASLIATAQYSGLRGSKTDEYLQRMTAAIVQLGENGMSLNLAGTEQFMRRLATTGAFQGAGLAQTRLFTGIEGAAVGARNQILSNYGGIGQNALMGAALRKGGGVTGAAEYLASLSTDEKREIITREYGASAAQTYFMSLGLNEAQGRDATGQLGQGGYMKLQTRGAGALKNAYAASERRLLGMIDKDDVGLFKQKSDADAIIMSIGKAGQQTVELLGKVVDMMSSVDATASGIADAVRAALDAVKNL